MDLLIFAKQLTNALVLRLFQVLGNLLFSPAVASGRCATVPRTDDTLRPTESSEHVAAKQSSKGCCTLPDAMESLSA